MFQAASLKNSSQLFKCGCPMGVRKDLHQSSFPLCCKCFSLKYVFHNLMCFNVTFKQAHRLRALDLLGRFLDLGPWAVNLALSVGIFPYVLKLLQSSARELRPLLVFIWAKILAVDSSCQVDLVRDQSHKYFLTVLQVVTLVVYPPGNILILQDPAMLPQHKTWAVFVLSSVVKGYKQGQDEAVAGNLISICLDEMEEADPVFKQWLAICLGTVWDKHEEAR